MRQSLTFSRIAALLLFHAAIVTINMTMPARSFRPSAAMRSSAQQQQQQQQQQHNLNRLDTSPGVRLCSAAEAARFTQVVSDVDDTLKSSGGVNAGGIYLGGIDVQYERGDLYPGVGEFMLELSRHGLSPGDENTPAKIAILTARAEEFKAVLEIKPSSKLAVALREAGESAGVENWGIGPVLYGSVVEWIDQSNKGRRKFTNFEKLIRQDPTGGDLMRYIYVGDTGELDQEAGETMLREYPELVAAVFLHVVSADPEGPPFIPPPRLINGRPVVFFRTYVGAACDACQLGLMDPGGLQRVVSAATEQLTRMGGAEEEESPSSSSPSSSKWRDLRIDIARADSVLVPGEGGR